MDTILFTAQQQFGPWLAALAPALPHELTVYVWASLTLLVWLAHFGLSRELRRNSVPVEERYRARREE